MDEEASCIDAVRHAQRTVPSIRHSDGKFPADSRSLALLSGDQTDGVERVAWDRPDAVARRSGEDESTVVLASFGESSMVQGLLGDRYFLSALGAVARAASAPGSEEGSSRIDSLLTTPDDDIESTGVVAGQFYSCVSTSTRRPGTPGRSRSRGGSSGGGGAGPSAAGDGPEWCVAVTDSRLPHVAKPGTEGEGEEEVLPLYGCSGSGADGLSESWVGLVEKAYAAFWSGRRWQAPRPSSRGRGASRDARPAASGQAAEAEAEAAVGYRAVHRGGSLAAALVDLTGGTVETALLRSPRVAATLRSDVAGGLWSVLVDHTSRGHVVVATAGGPDGLPAVDGEDGEARWDSEQGIAVDGSSGLLTLHPYPVLWAGEPRKGLRIVKLANPWTRQEEFLGAGWSGDWAAESELWAEHPDVEASLASLAADGDTAAQVRRSATSEFWMAWEDVATHFASVALCRLPDVGAAPRAHLGPGARNGMPRGFGVGRGRGAALPAGSAGTSALAAQEVAASIALAALDAGAEDAAATAAAISVSSRLGLVGPPTARPSQLWASQRRMAKAAGGAVSPSELEPAPPAAPVAGMRSGAARGSGDGGDEVLAITGALQGRVPRAADAAEAVASHPGAAPCLSLTRRVPLPQAAAVSTRPLSTAPSAAVAVAAAGAGLPVTGSTLSADAASRLATEWSADVAGGGKCPVPAQWMRPDGDPRFFAAPQFRILGPAGPAPGQAVPAPTDVLLSVTQLDPRQRRRILPRKTEDEDGGGGDDPAPAAVDGAGGAATPGAAALDGRPGSSLEARDGIPTGVAAAVRACVPVEFAVVRRSRGQGGRLWELSEAEIVASSSASPLAPPSDVATGLPTQREAVLPSLRLESDSSYVLVATLAPPPRLPVGLGHGPGAGDAGAAGDAAARQIGTPAGGGAEGDAAAVGASGAASGAASLFSELDDGESLPFSLRVFAPVGRDVRAVALPQPAVATVRGRWSAAAATACGAPLLPAGGPNGEWGLGPQVLLRVDVDAAKRADRLEATMRSRDARATRRRGRGAAEDGAEASAASTPSAAVGGAPASLAHLARPGAHVTVKLVLRRTDRGAGRDDEGGVMNRVGMVVTRALRATPGGASAAPGGEDAMSRTVALGASRPGHAGATMRSTGRPGATGSLGDTSSAAADDGAATDAVLGHDTAAPDSFRRRKAVAASEWVWSTDWRSHAVATATLRVPAGWVSGGRALCLHPLLRVPGAEGSWQLEAHASVPLALDPLQEPGNARLSSRWEGRLAAGCRLHAEWLRNPAFLLRPADGDELRDGVSYRLALERPEGPWRRAVKKDGVGTMLGMYVLAVPLDCPDLARIRVRQPRGAAGSGAGEEESADGAEGVLLAETTFLPMERVALPLHVDWRTLGGAANLVVVCCTFGPGHEGPFRLEVARDDGPAADLTPFVATEVAGHDAGSPPPEA